MTTNEKAEALARECHSVLQMDGLGDDAALIKDLCCLPELLRVAEKAQRIVDSCEANDAASEECRDAMAALLALRLRLPKGVEI